MATLDYPADPIFHGATCALTLASNTWSFRSPISGAVQTVGMPGDRWKIRISWDNTTLTPAESGAVQAFLVSLRGMANRVRVWNLARPSPRGLAAGAPIVYGAQQVGSQVLTSGWQASTAGLLLPGDMIGIGGELKMVTASVDSDADGRATIRFEPELRSSPTNGSPIVVTKAAGVFLSTASETSWMEVPGLRSRGYALDLIEDFRR